MALAHCILGKFLGVVCHCFPPHNIPYPHRKRCNLFWHLVFYIIFCRFWQSHAASTKTGQPSGKWRNETNVCPTAPMILGVEVALQLSVDRKCDLRYPNLLLNIPLRLWGAVAVSTWCSKHTGHICSSLNISRKNRNPMNLWISDSCVMSAMLLESILSDSEKCV